MTAQKFPISRVPPKSEIEIRRRYADIVNLWIAYFVNNDDGPEVFGREFYQAVGEIVEGRRVHQLELYHVKPTAVESVVSLGRLDGKKKRNGNGRPDTKRDRKNR